MRFWISWWQPTKDPRPLKDPPNPAILGAWYTGVRADDASSCCALVEAKDEDAARAAVRIDWPEAAEWRFCNQVDDAWRPGDRFPLTDRDRLRIAGGSPGGGAA